MSNQLESALVRKIIAHLRTLPSIYFYRTHGGPFVSRSGVPDLIICKDGFFIGIEVKIAPNTPTPLQKIELSKIRMAGGIGGVAYSLEDAKALLAKISTSADPGL